MAHLPSRANGFRRTTTQCFAGRFASRRGRLRHQPVERFGKLRGQLASEVGDKLLLVSRVQWIGGATAGPSRSGPMGGCLSCLQSRKLPLLPCGVGQCGLALRLQLLD